MIDTLVMCLVGLSVLTDPLKFFFSLYNKENPDLPPNPNDFPEQTGWKKYISIKRDSLQSN